jgi:hypothetical protein
MNPVSCLKCAFLRGSFEDGRKKYRCEVKESRIVNINDQIMCSRFQRQKKKIANREIDFKNNKVYPENYFDAETLRSMAEKREVK